MLSRQLFKSRLSPPPPDVTSSSACVLEMMGGSPVSNAGVLNVRGVFVISPVGYTMRDIRYKWNEGPNSVGVSNEVSLPQFKVLGHRQRAMEISLTTGKVSDPTNNSSNNVHVFYINTNPIRWYIYKFIVSRPAKN